MKKKIDIILRLEIKLQLEYKNLIILRYFIVMPYSVQYFFVFPYGEKINSADGLSTLEYVTYNCPCEKQGNSWFTPHSSKDFFGDYSYLLKQFQQTILISPTISSEVIPIRIN